MSDTHGVNGEGWIGFDLDGTLAKYDGWHGIDHIGEPIGPMVDLMKKLHGQGRYVKIVTARVAPQKLEDGTFGEPYITVPQDDGGATRQYASQYIQDWCHFNLGFVPEIVYQKDCRMLELYDDRVKQVVPNKGVPVEDLANYYEALVECYRHMPDSNAAAMRILAQIGNAIQKKMADAPTRVTEHEYAIMNLCLRAFSGSIPTPQIGNAAAMREALESALQIVRGIIDGTLARRNQSVFDCRDQLKAALSAPPRNCDVGTAVEQYGRYIKFCNRRRLMKSDCDMDCPCAAKNFNDHFCQLEWAQMPYEEGGAK